MHHDNLDDNLDDRHRSSKDDTALHFEYCVWVLCGGSKIQISMDERDADNLPFIFRIKNYHVQQFFPLSMLRNGNGGGGQIYRL